MSKMHSLRLSVSVALLLGAIALPAQSQQADGAKFFSSSALLVIPLSLEHRLVWVPICMGF